MTTSVKRIQREPEQRPATVTPCLCVRNLAVAFNGIKIVDNISFTASGSAIIGIAGPNGAGKTTVLDLICGLSRPSGGVVEYKGRRIDGLPPWKIARLGIGRGFQSARLFKNLTAVENVLVALPCHWDLPWNMVSQWLSRPHRRQSHAEAVSLLKRVGLGTLQRKPAGDLSHGQQKLLSLVRLMATGSAVMLLDEPTAGVDAAARQIVVELLLELRSEGCLIVLVEHNLDVLRNLADQVLFMQDGNIRAKGRPNEVFDNQEVQRAYIHA